MVFSLGFWVGVGAGGAFIWFFKDKLLAWVLGAEGLAAHLQAKAAALLADIKKL